MASTEKWLSIFLLFLCLAFNLKSRLENRNLTELIHAENSFAKKAFETSIKTAFLENLDSSGVLFNNAKPVNGILAYTQTPDRREELLSWYPTMAHVSSAGDLGFTSGPYQFFAERGKEPVGSGYFFSIWKRNAAGKFKVILDAGVPGLKDHANAFERSPRPDSTDYDFLPMTYSPNTKKEEPWESEKTFTELAKTDPDKAYDAFLAENSLLLWNDRQAGLSKSTNLATLAAEKIGSCGFAITDRGMSQSADLAYCYGEVTLGKGTNARRGFFVRVWHFQEAGWKIVTEEISLTQRRNPSH
ncbi:nuclear transport factor 2 family protein [Dyadobacter sp. CY323]|uniref:nuclear transport factor 2 family protein n=1 Tax=Dyadobacter sp. CY323 TaxID=2907302 RepID=UPI001F28114D|nr:nuclear transport factor 2 family protein [Dyadobacter sp. CY323]MCE6991873.1 nuclear transport factor 2 family protein [Dyadobacter sp. CY323]